MSDHECPVDACQRQVPSHQLMCRLHWRMVSPNLQSRLYRAYARGRGALSDVHLEVIRLCVDEVNSKHAR